MPFAIVRNDITQMRVDAIVNTANPRPVIGAGTDTRIHEEAGPQLILARRKIGDIARGDAAITPAYNLNAKYVIHTVGPVWEGGSCGEEALLRSCYEKSLQLVVQHKCRSVAFPLISTGHYGFPKDQALQIAISVFSAFLLEQDIRIYLVVYDNASYKLSEKLFQDVASYIDENYVTAYAFECDVPETRGLPRHAQRRMPPPFRGEILSCSPKALSLEDVLEQEDAGFTETLLNWIDRSGKKDSEVYKRANISKQHFSKIRNNPQYKPTKATALALAIALELNLDETRDLIGRAGYALSNSSKFDLIIRYYIEQKNYNIVQINITLYEFDQSLLGA